MSTAPLFFALYNRPCPATVADLVDVIRAVGNVAEDNPMDRLAQSIRQSPAFLRETLPFLWQEALRAVETLHDIPMLAAPGSVVLTQRQCLCILANAFFCTFARPSEDCPDDNGLASINFDELYGGEGWGPVEIAKLHMFFEYFERCRRRLAAGDALARIVETTRRRARASSAVDWTSIATSLVPPVVRPLGESIDLAKDMIRVDFASPLIGGAVLSYGCVQEEILFSVCPELVATRLFCPAMGDDEAIVILGSEQFAVPNGYGSELRFGGGFVDPTRARSDGTLDSHVVAIDAVDFRWTERHWQFESECVLRELTKCWAGFDLPAGPSAVATGNWGCGEFRGDPLLKCLIQWSAASRAGKTMHYFPWDSGRIHDEFSELAAWLIEQGTTIGKLSAVLLDGPDSGDVFGAVRRRIAADTRAS